MRFATIRESSVRSPRTAVARAVLEAQLRAPSPRVSVAARATAELAERVEADDVAAAACGVLGASEGEEALEEPVDVVELAAEPTGERRRLRQSGGRACERDVERRAHRRERRPQLVRGVRDEAPLRLERALEPAEQPVDRVAELAQFVAGPPQVEPLVEVRGGELPGGHRDRADRPEDPAGDQPAEDERDEGHRG